MRKMSMNKGKKASRSIPLVALPQLVPRGACLSCDVCCRFPEQESFLRPYFTEEEMAFAVTQGIDPAYFSDSDGCQIAVVPHPHGEGYLCPAFDPATSFCRIYEGRPLDCQIYPFTMMWDAERKAVLLGWDRKCPYMMTEAVEGREFTRLTHEADSHASRICERFERDEALITLVIRNPHLVTPFQEDVVAVARLESLTSRLSLQRSP